MKLKIFIFAVLIQSLAFTGEIKAVIFDCDGTLIDNGNGFFLTWEYALRRQGYELSPEQFWKFMNVNGLVGSAKADDMIANYYNELLGCDCKKQLLEDKKGYGAQLRLKYEFPPIEPTVNFLRHLAKEKESLGLKLGLASGGPKTHILRVLTRFNLDQCFDVIVSGTDDLAHYNDGEGTNKPKPYIYQHAAQLLGIAPEECVAIEDSHVGVSSAVNAKCITVAVPNACTMGEDLSQAHLKIVSFEGITPVDFLQIINQK